MRLLTTFLFLLSTVSSMGQELKKVKKKLDEFGSTEQYYVLKSDKKIKHGNYKKNGYGNGIEIDGFYKNNEKDSIWTEYFSSTEIIKNQGAYKRGEKTGFWIENQYKNKTGVLIRKGEFKEGLVVGVWEFFDDSSNLVKKYNYTTKELLYFKPDDEAYQIKTDSGMIKTKLDRPPVHVKNLNIENEQQSRINYPAGAKATGISGKVLISFIIDMEGQAINHKVEKGIGGGCDEEALRFLKENFNNWVPAQLNGQIVIVKYDFPISFTLR